MNLDEFKKEFVRQELGIGDNFPEVFSFIDFGNVNYWFDDDRQTHDHIALAEEERLCIDIEKLDQFLSIFSKTVRFYYGHDSANTKSLGFIRVARDIFGKHAVSTKPIQKVRHHLLSPEELTSNTRTLFHDDMGDYVFLPKCNFDVEISVDAIKLLDNYDTFCLLSSDADFVHLLRYLKSKKKKIILIKGGPVVHDLKDIADLVVNAQDIKKHISLIKQKPGI
ncbi:MAG: NYN domain-containing protein [Candidatus Paceibacterota bacterium]|jgi:uncharacterized LabA/DUF88 family protein